MMDGSSITYDGLLQDKPMLPEGGKQVPMNRVNILDFVSLQKNLTNNCN